MNRYFVQKGDETMDTIREGPSDIITTHEMSFMCARDPSPPADDELPLPAGELRRDLFVHGDLDESVAVEGSLRSETVGAKAIQVFLRVKPFPKKVQYTTEQKEAYQILNSTTLHTRLPGRVHPSVAMEGTSQAGNVSKDFTFSKIFSPERTQSELFNETIQPEIVKFLKGQNCMIMTYGSTNPKNSWWTMIPHTLESIFKTIHTESLPHYKLENYSDVIDLTEDQGWGEIVLTTNITAPIITNKIQHLNPYLKMVRQLEMEAPQRPPPQKINTRYSIWVSYAKIQGDKIYALLQHDSKRKLQGPKLETDKQGRKFVQGLCRVYVSSPIEAHNVLLAGQSNMKAESEASRSSFIFTLNLIKFQPGNEAGGAEISRLSFCDVHENFNTKLNGLMRWLSSISQGQGVKESDKASQPPCLSPLTTLFQEAFSRGDAMAMLVSIDPSPICYAENQQILECMEKAMQISASGNRQHPADDEDENDNELSNENCHLKAELKKLTEELRKKDELLEKKNSDIDNFIKNMNYLLSTPMPKLFEDSIH